MMTEEQKNLTSNEHKCCVCKTLLTKKSQKLCSDICRKIHGTMKSKKKYNELKIISRKNATCIVCLKEFEYHFRPDRGERSFCSRSCASKSYIKNGTYDAWRLRKNPLQDRHIVNCVVCGQEKLVLERELNEHKKNNSAHCCDRFCQRKYVATLLSSRPGHPFTEAMRQNQKITMLERHGVTNAFMLAKRRIKTKPQIKIYEWLQENFKDLDFKIEKLVCSNPKEIFADIVSFSHKLVIEFNGDFWHCNPTLYESDFKHPIKSQTAQEIWDSDKARVETLKQQGFDVYIIWESDYNRFGWASTLTNWVKTHAKKEDITTK